MSGQLVQFLLSPAAVKWALGTVGTTLLSLSGFIVKRTLRVAKEKLIAAELKLSNIEQKITIQAENHLKTIQDESKEQTKLLRESKEIQIDTNAQLKTFITILSNKLAA